MKIIAKTNDGCLISASENELKEILTSVSGVRPKELEIGQKIPAIDYATTISKIKGLEHNYDYKNMISKIDEFTNIFETLKLSVTNASNINEGDGT